MLHQPKPCDHDHYHPLVLGKQPLRPSELSSIGLQILWRFSAQSWSRPRPVEGSSQINRQRDHVQHKCRPRWKPLLTSWVKVSEEVVEVLRNSLVGVVVIMCKFWASVTSIIFSSGVKNTRYLTLRPASPVGFCSNGTTHTHTHIECTHIKKKKKKGMYTYKGGWCQTCVARPICDPGIDWRGRA